MWALIQIGLPMLQVLSSDVGEVNEARLQLLFSVVAFLLQASILVSPEWTCTQRCSALRGQKFLLLYRPADHALSCLHESIVCVPVAHEAGAVCACRRRSMRAC